MTERASDSRRLLPGDGASSRGARAAGRMNRAKPTTVRRPSAAAKPSGASLRATTAGTVNEWVPYRPAWLLKRLLQDIINSGQLKSIDIRHSIPAEHSHPTQGSCKHCCLRGRGVGGELLKDKGILALLGIYLGRTGYLAQNHSP